MRRSVFTDTHHDVAIIHIVARPVHGGISAKDSSEKRIDIDNEFRTLATNPRCALFALRCNGGGSSQVDRFIYSVTEILATGCPHR